MVNPQLVVGETVQGGVPIAKEYKTVGTMTAANEFVRDFRKKELSPEGQIFKFLLLAVV